MAYVGQNPKFTTQTYRPQSADPSNPTEGMVQYSDGTARAEGLWVYKDSGWRVVGNEAAGLINHVLNPDFEVDASGWATYADAAASTPVNGTGGSPSSTFVRSTSSPLRGVASGLWSKSAANRQGEGFSYDLSIDTADQGKIQQISFDYTVTANYVDGDMRVFIFDVTNSLLIEPSQRDILANAGQASYLGYFQASPNSTSYRLIIHTATVSALAYDLKIDNILEGPIEVGNAGTFVSDWQSYTPVTQGFGTISSVQVFKRRVGSQLEVFGRFAAGTVAGSEAQLGIDGLSINAAEFSSSKIIGEWWRANSSATTRKRGNLLGSSGQSYVTFASDDYTTAASPSANLNGNVLASTSDVIFFKFSVPIAGWTTGINASEVSSSAAIAFSASQATQTGINTNNSTVQLTFDTIAIDTAGGGNDSTNQYQIPESGLYFLTAFFRADTTNVLNNRYYARLFVNGSVVANGIEQTPPAAANFSTDATFLGLLNKGDLVDMRLFGAGNNSSSTISGSTRLQIFKLNNPAQIAPMDFIGCNYSTNSGQAVVTGNTIIFEDRVYDSSLSYNTSTGVYTVNVSGKYRLYYNLNTAAISATVGNLFGAQMIQAGSVSVSKDGSYDVCQNTTSREYFSQGENTFDCIKGDTLKVQFSETLPAVNLAANGNYNYLTITKVS